MTDRLDPTLWEEVLAQIQRELPSQAYETWFQPTRAIAATADSLVIEVPSPFFRDWLASHYTELIDRVLHEVCRAKGVATDPIRLEFTTAPQGVHAPVALTERGASSPAETAPRFLPDSKPQSPSDVTLNSRYTFDQFVIGPSNRFAHAAALAITESPAKVYNPLFIYGGVGLGKTHLMQAIGNRLRERFSTARCIYLSSERFTNQLISAIQNRTMVSFRERFRGADVLLVDDIHFIGGKEATQEVFFHTFNTLYDAHKQIVISSDRSPKELRGVEERLISRFEWGLVTDVQPPDLETRVAILRKKALSQGESVPDEVTLFIAERVSSNIRELEGALNRVIAYGVLTSRQITLGLAQEVLKGLVAENAKLVTLDRIQRVVADHFNLSVADLRGKRRTKEVSLPRQIAMALAREMTDFSLPAIGEAFGGRDHATVIYACQKIKGVRESNGSIRQILESLSGQLQEKL